MSSINVEKRWSSQHMHDTKNLRLWVVTNKLESVAKYLCESKPFKTSTTLVLDIMAFIEVWEDYALLLKGTSWGSESSVKPLAVLTRITCDKRTPSSYGSASVFRIRMLIILKYRKF